MNFSDISIRKARPQDVDALTRYYHSLGEETRRRYGPHPFDEVNAVRIAHGENPRLQAFLALDGHQEIAGYHLILEGWIDADERRYRQYGFSIHPDTDVTYAPSVADAWKGKGLSTFMWRHILESLEQQGKKRIILWGGVQATNAIARGYYLKTGFVEIAEFEHNGPNVDMMREI